MGDRTRLILVLMLVLIAISIANGTELSREVPASEVLAKIKAGQPAEFDNCTIVGDLNLSTLKIEGPFHFNHTLFQNSVNFNLTIFNGTVDFGYSNFKGYANFGYTNFNSIADFRSSNFKGDVTFESTNFNGYANFESTNFKGDANFIFSNFKGDAAFGYSNFNSTATFWSSNFKGDANFGSSNFNSIADFRISNFNSTASFWSSNFNSIADFRFSNFKGDATFWSSNFNSIADFRSSNFKGDTFFYNTTFKNALNLTLTKYDKLYIRWNSNSNLAYDDTAYQLLTENLKKLGFMADADVCYYQFRVGQFLHQNLVDDPFMFIFNFGAWIFYGYGKKPLYPFLWSIFFIVFFGVFWTTVNLPSPKDAINKYSLDKSRPRRVFSLFLIPFIIVVWKVVGLKKAKRAVDEYDQVGNWPPNMKDAISFSATVFLSGTKFLVDPPGIPVLPGMSQSMIKRAFLLERVLGAFFSILFFLAIGATVVR